MPLAVLVANDPEASPALCITAPALSAAIAQRIGATPAIDIHVNDDPAHFEAVIVECAPTALFAARAVDLRRAQALAPGLRWVQATSAGVEKHLATLPRGMTLTNASGVHAEKGAEFILAAALMLVYDIPRFASAKERREWSPVYGGVLAGRTVALLGVGAIGAAAARLLRPFGVKLIGVTRSGASDADLDSCVATDAVDDVLRAADIVVSTLPLTAGTRGLIDRRRIGLLRPDAGLVVVGRARVFDYDAMMDRLEAGTLRGAVLDVYPVEPVPVDDRLWRCPRLVMTPHCSVDDHDHYAARCIDLFADNLRRLIAGEPLRNVVDPASGY
jgi:phosphoglycerate dehydrogenase-like enzyme